MNDLIRPLDLGFEKTSGIQLSIDPNHWTTDVVKHVAEEYPYLLQLGDSNVIWKAIDHKQGYGFGGLYVINRGPRGMKQNRGQYHEQIVEMGPRENQQEDAVRQLVVPLIVRAYELSPLDVFVFERKVYPLSERRIHETLFTGRMFSEAERERPTYGQPEMMADQSIADKLYPPPESVYGYGAFGYPGSGSGGITTYGSSGSGPRDAFALSDVVATTASEADRAAFFAFAKKGDAELGAMLLGGLEPFLAKILGHVEAAGEDAEVLRAEIFPPNVVRIRPAAGRDGIFEVTEVSDEGYEPRHRELSLEETLSEYGQLVPELRDRVLTGDTTVLTLEHEIVDPIVLERYEASADPVVGEGRHVLLTRDGDFRVFSVIPSVCELSGDVLEGVKLFTDGQTWGMQASLVGEATGEPNDLREGKIRPGVTGTFVFNRNGAMCATIPFRVQSQTIDQERQRLSMSVIDSYGYEHLLIVTPGINRIVSATGIQRNTDLGRHLLGNIWHVPADYIFLELGKKTSAAEHVDQVNRGLRARMSAMIDRHADAREDFAIEGDTHAAERRRDESEKHPTGSPDSPRNPGSTLENTIVRIARAPRSPVTTLTSTTDHFILEGRMLERTEHATAQAELPEKEAIFLLATLGLSIAQATDLLRQALEGPIHVANLRPPAPYETKTATDVALLDKIAQALRKEAWREGVSLCLPVREARNVEAYDVMREFLGLEKKAIHEVAPDAETVDTVLSLGFINPENVAAFLQKIPELRETEARLGELLLLIRLGLQGIDDKPVQNALKSLNKVTEGLEALASYGLAA